MERLDAERLILEALDDGRLRSEDHAGMALPSMHPNDAGWWVRALVERESLPDRYRAATELASTLLDRAISTTDLATARIVLGERNAGVRRWNDSAPETHQIPEVDETDLLDRRRRFRSTSGD